MVEVEGGPARTRRRALAVATALPLVFLLRSFSQRPSPDDAFTRFMALVPATTRRLPARVSGIRWAPLRPVLRGSAPEDTSQLRLLATAARVLDGARGTRSAKLAHESAVVELLTGASSAAIRTLEAVDVEQRSAAMWSDLAASHLALAERSDGAMHIRDGLGATYRALSLEPRHAAALFNRALLIERLGLRDAAHDAWGAYLAVDPASAWAGEARVHDASLTVNREPFRSALEGAYVHMEGAAPRLVDEYPQDARAWGETEILGRWAEAYLAHDGVAAARHLSVARSLGRAVAARRGEQLLSSAVASIEEVSEGRRGRLAQAHASYRRGRIEYSQQHATAAYALLRDAAMGFAAGGSPMELVARYYAGSALYDQNRIDDAVEALSELQKRTPAHFIALQAQVDWTLGLAYAAQGDLGTAIRRLRESDARFRRLGERTNAAFVRGLLADAHDTLGAFEASWGERLSAISDLGHEGSNRTVSVLSGAARTSTRQKQWAAAAAFLEIEVEASRAQGPAQLLVDSLLRRAYAEWKLGSLTAAHESVAAAETTARSIADPAHRARAGADVAWTTALLVGDTRPAEAVRLLTSAIDFHGTSGRRSFLPDLYLARAQALLASRSIDAARSDLAAGITQLEKERSSIPASDRLGIFDTVNDLFETAMAVELQAGNIEAAFQLAERSRARALLDTRRGAYEGVLRTAITPGTTILEYARVRDQLVRFEVGPNHIEAVRQGIGRDALQALIDRFRAALRGGDAMQARLLGGELHALLIGEGLPGGTSDGRLVIVPSGALEGVPFAALFDRVAQRYLIEDRTIVVAPSAATYLLGLRQVKPSAHPHLLAVADPARDDLPRLYASVREVEAIAGLYTAPAILSGTDATGEAFVEHARRADVIHYAGHAVADEEGLPPSLLFASSSGSGRMDVADIARLKLRATVVVLAACATADGKGRGAEGTGSLARAFLSAGALTTIATLWPIEDQSASGLFARLHEAIASGSPPAEALRAVQIQSIRGADAPALAWAAIEVIGS
jgi:tetratricopeptide (TPR) repeat protein